LALAQVAVIKWVTAEDRSRSVQASCVGNVTTVCGGNLNMQAANNSLPSQALNQA
jgi:hypothetical protein